jgi:hypothetical protein
MNLLGIMVAKLFDPLFHLIGTKQEPVYSKIIIPKNPITTHGRTRT